MQASRGDQDAPRPRRVDVADRLEWEAWEQFKGMKAEEAAAQYADYVDELCEDLENV